MKKNFVALLMLFLCWTDLFAQNDFNATDKDNFYKYLPTLTDTSTGQIFVFIDSLPQNIFYPHTYSWDGEKWKLQIEIDAGFISSDLKAAVTKSGLLFFIKPVLNGEQYIVFRDGKWTYSPSSITN